MVLARSSIRGRPVLRVATIDKVQQLRRADPANDADYGDDAEDLEFENWENVLHGPYPLISSGCASRSDQRNAASFDLQAHEATVNWLKSWPAFRYS